IFDATTRTDADPGLAVPLMLVNGLEGFVIIATEAHNAMQLRARTNEGAQADDAVRNLRLIDNAAIRNQRMINLRPVDLGAREETRAAENGRAHVEEIE